MSCHDSQTEHFSKVTEEILETGVEDEFGALYSPDGKRLLKGNDSGTYIYNIKEGTEVICDFAFQNSDVTKIIIPASVAVIGDNPFEFFNEIESQSSRFVVQDGMLIDLQEGRLISHFGKEESLVVPDSVIHIGCAAFRSCFSLKSVSLPSTIQVIGKYAFAFSIDCAVQWVNPPASLNYIGDLAFMTTKSVKITLPATLTDIGVNPFCYCRNIEIKSKSDRFSFRNGMLIDLQEKRLISYVWNERFVVVPDSVSIIGDSAFKRVGANDITSVALPATLTSIGNGAFDDCKNLENINLPSSLRTIGNQAFAGCCNLSKDFTIPASVVNMGNNPFEHVKNIHSESSRFIVTDNNMLIDTMDGRLVTCFDNQEHVVLPTMIKYIGENAFHYGPSFATIVIPSWMDGLERADFWDCNCLKKAYIPQGSIMKFKEMLPEKVWGKLREKNVSSLLDGNTSFFKRIIKKLFG